MPLIGATWMSLAVAMLPQEQFAHAGQRVAIAVFVAGIHEGAHPIRHIQGSAHGFGLIIVQHEGHLLQRFAVARARARDPELDVFEGTAFDLPFKDGRFDLVFTSGVLIHIGPDQLGAALAEMARVSRRYLLTIEYDHEREVEIAYRGHAAALWKRDHAAAVTAHCPGFARIRTGFLRPADGYDDCTYHVFERTAP